MIASDTRLEPPSLTTDQMQSYQQEGFLLCRGLLPPATLSGVQGQLEDAVERQARDWLSAGRISDLRRDLSFAERLAALAQGDDLGRRAWDEAVGGQVLEDVIADLQITRVVRALLAGPDPATDAVYPDAPALRFNGDSHLRPKLPGSMLTSFPWHQDSQYYGAPTAVLHIITVWLPLVAVDLANGCLQVVPGSQRWGLLGGGRGADQNIRCDEDPSQRGTPVAMPMAVGDVLFFHNLLVHGSAQNTSNTVRWSLDLRYSAPPRDPAHADADAWFLTRLRSLNFRPRPSRRWGLAADSGSGSV